MQLEELFDTKKLPLHDPIVDGQPFVKIGGNGVLIFSPKVLHFGGYKLNKVHRTVVRVLNQSTVSQRVHIVTPTTIFFKARYSKKGIIAPGMSEDITVEFRPNEWRYFYDCIRLHSETGNMLLPLHAYPVMNNAIFPDIIDFGKCSLGETVEKKVYIRSEVPIEFEYELTVTQAHPDFEVWPMQGVVPGNCAAEIVVRYRPVALASVGMGLSVNISQFNFTPFKCQVVGSAQPGMVREKAVLTLANMLSASASAGDCSLMPNVGATLTHNSSVASELEEEDRVDGISVDVPEETVVECGEAAGLITPDMLPDQLWMMKLQERGQHHRGSSSIREGVLVHSGSTSSIRGTTTAAYMHGHLSPRSEMRRQLEKFVGGSEGAAHLHVEEDGDSSRSTAAARLMEDIKVKGRPVDWGGEAVEAAARRRLLRKGTIRRKGVPEKEVVVEGLRIPPDLSGVHALNYVLTQQPGKLKPKDLAAAIARQRTLRQRQKQEQEELRARTASATSSGGGRTGFVGDCAVSGMDATALLSEEAVTVAAAAAGHVGLINGSGAAAGAAGVGGGVDTRQLKEMVFLQDLQELDRREREREFVGLQDHLGHAIPVVSSVELVLQLRAAAKRCGQRCDRQLARSRCGTEAFLSGNARCSSAALAPSTAVPTFDSYINNVWVMRRAVLTRLRCAVSRLIIRRRAQRRLHAIRARLAGARTRAEVRRLVESDARSAQLGRDAGPEEDPDTDADVVSALSSTSSYTTGNGGNDFETGAGADVFGIVLLELETESLLGGPAAATGFLSSQFVGRVSFPAYAEAEARARPEQAAYVEYGFQDQGLHRLRLPAEAQLLSHTAVGQPIVPCHVPLQAAPPSNAAMSRDSGSSSSFCGTINDTSRQVGSNFSRSVCRSDLLRKGASHEEGGGSRRGADALPMRPPEIVLRAWQARQAAVVAAAEAEFGLAPDESEMRDPELQLTLLLAPMSLLQPALVPGWKTLLCSAAAQPLPLSIGGSEASSQHILRPRVRPPPSACFSCESNSSSLGRASFAALRDADTVSDAWLPYRETSGRGRTLTYAWTLPDAVVRPRGRGEGSGVWTTAEIPQLQQATDVEVLSESESEDEDARTSADRKLPTPALARSMFRVASASYVSALSTKSPGGTVSKKSKVPCSARYFRNRSSSSASCGATGIELGRGNSSSTSVRSGGDLPYINVERDRAVVALGLRLRTERCALERRLPERMSAVSDRFLDVRHRFTLWQPVHMPQLVSPWFHDFYVPKPNFVLSRV